MGDAKGARGVVTGKHGGIEHVLVDFPPEILEKLMLGGRVLVKAYGVGLKLLDFPDIKTMNMGPQFLEAINPKVKDEKPLGSRHACYSRCHYCSGLGANQLIPEAMTFSFSMKMFAESMDLTI